MTDALPMTNSLFRAYRFAADDPAFAGRDLTPGDPITGPVEPSGGGADAGSSADAGSTAEADTGSTAEPSEADVGTPDEGDPDAAGPDVTDPTTEDAVNQSPSADVVAPATAASSTSCAVNVRGVSMAPGAALLILVALGALHRARARARRNAR